MFIRKILSILHFRLLKIYDYFTAKEDTVLLSQILCLHDKQPTYIQFLIASRVLDAENYITEKDTSFKYQNAISHAIYGKHHLEEEGNESFRSLIVSYLKSGHDDKFPPPFVDLNFNLIDGTHRIALCYILNISPIRVMKLARRSPFPTDISFYKLQIPPNIYTDIWNKVIEIDRNLCVTE